MRRMESRRTLSSSAIALALALFASTAFVPALRAEAKEDEHGHDHGAHAAEPTLAGASKEAIWDRFVEHLHGLEREDLLPAAPIHEDVLSELTTEIELPDADVHPEHPMPDIAQGDPVRGTLFKLSKDLVVLDAWMTEDDLLSRPVEKRGEKISTLVEKLRASEDPFLKAYAEYYAAQWLLERGEIESATHELEELVESEHFFAKEDARKSLIDAYRRAGRKTHAILEVQFFLAELPAEATADRSWAREELVAIREGHEGPLHECATRKRALSTRLLDREHGDPVQGEQRDVELVLTKIADLLEDQAGRCPNCQERVSQKTGECKNTCEECGECKGSSTTQVSHQEPKPGEGQGKPGEGKKPGEGQGKPGEGQGQPVSAGQKPCPNCVPGEGQTGANPGTDTPTDVAAEDTKFKKERSDKEALRDRELADTQAWGRVNDREVEASLQELWSKMPGLYRNLVSQYFSDLSEVETKN